MNLPWGYRITRGTKSGLLAHVSCQSLLCIFGLPKGKEAPSSTKDRIKQSKSSDEKCNHDRVMKEHNADVSRDLWEAGGCQLIIPLF